MPMIVPPGIVYPAVSTIVQLVVPVAAVGSTGGTSATFAPKYRKMLVVTSVAVLPTSAAAWLNAIASQ
jgi:hypothetical protein